MTSHYASEYYSTTAAMPIAGKDDSYAQYDSGYYPVAGGHSSYSVSPPESVNASTTSGSNLYSSGSAYSTGGYSSGDYSTGGYPSAAASYAGSSHGGDYEVSSAYTAGNNVDFSEYVQDRLDDFGNPIRLDKCMATQAQVSGRMNAKERQLLERTEKVKARLAKSRAAYAEGLAMAREVHSDLQWTHDSIVRSQAMASKKHSREYRKARERYPDPEY